MRTVPLILAIVLLTFQLSACTSSASQYSTDQVIAAFKDAGLEVNGERKLTSDDMGIAPMKFTEGVYFTTGDDHDVRVMSFKKKADLEDLKKFYDELGGVSALFFFWTAAKGNILIVLSGDMEENQFNAFKSALESLK